MTNTRKTLDYLIWLVPALLLGSLTPLILRSNWVGSPLVVLLMETVAAFAALGVVVAGLLHYSLRRTRLLLFLSLSFLAASLIDILNVLVSTARIGLDLDQHVSSTPDTWAAGSASLAVLLLVGLALDRFAPVAQKALGEVLRAAILALSIAGVMVLALLLVGLPAPKVTIAGFSQPEQFWVGALYLAALPLYFRVYQRQRSHLWRAVVVAIVISVFGQVWAASSSAPHDALFLAAHTAKLAAYITVLTGFQLLGAGREREALSAAQRRGLILRVSEAASQGGTDIDRMVERVSEAMAHALGVVRVAILLPEPGREALRIMGGYDTRRDFAPRVGALMPLASMPALERAMRESVVTHLVVDERHVLDPEILEDLRKADIGAVALVPLLVQGHSVGVVGISSPEKTWVPSPDEKALASAIAGQVATALENARLLAESEEQARLLAILYEVTASLNADLEPDEILTKIANQLRRALDVTTCALSEWDAMRDTVVTRVESGPPGWEWMPEKIFRLGAYPSTRRVIESQEPAAVYADDPEADPAERALMEAMGLQSLLMLPLVDKGRTIGLLELFDTRSRRFQPHEFELAQALAQQAGASFQRARLYNLERERSAQLSVLNWLSRAITTPIPDQATLEEFAQRLSLALRGANAVLVYAREPGLGTLRLGASIGLSNAAARDRAILRIRRPDVETVLTPDYPVMLPRTWEEDSPSTLALVLDLLEMDPLVGAAVYAEDELAMVVLLTFAPENLPGEREEDFLLTLSASLAHNLTSQRLFEDIAAERERLRAILASTSDAVVLTSRQAEIVLFNAAAERSFGVSEDEAVGRPLGDVLSYSAFVDIAERMLRGEIEDIERTDVVLSDGRVLLTSVAPVRAADGEILGYVIDMADVTEIQTLSELKSQMLRMASHDLLNPLSQALGAFEMLMEELPPLGPSDQELVNSVRMGHQRMHTLLRTLLDLERLEAGMLGERQVIGTDTLLEGVLSEMKPLASEHQQTLTAHFADDLPAIDVDVTQMHRAICNLVDNAIKYTPPGGSIEVRAEAVEGQVKIAVTDNGIGIPKEARAKLFQRFYRIHQPGTESVAGTGLGLSLVKSAVELHGGTVEVESTPGEGSTFTINLPAASEPSS